MGARQAVPRRRAPVRAASYPGHDWPLRWRGSFTAGSASFVFHVVLLLILACLLLSRTNKPLPDAVSVTFEPTLETEVDDPIDELEGQFTVETEDRFASSIATAPIRPETASGLSPGDLHIEISSTESGEHVVSQPTLRLPDQDGRRATGARSAGRDGIADDWNFPAGIGFEGRKPGNRTQLALLHGGTLASERAVEAGLDWLARHQRPDGSWSFEHLHEECGTDCTGPGTIDGSTAATGLALLCFLGAGNTHLDEGPWQETVKRGLEWLAAQSRVGDLRCSVDHAVPEHHSGMYAQGIATMALCEAVGMTHDRMYRREADAAIQFIIQSQDRYGGGWRYEPNERGDTSVLGWQVMALVSARMSGIAVPDAARDGTVTFLESVYNPATHRFGYLGRSRSTWATTAIGQLCSMYLRSSLSPELLRPDVTQLAATDPLTNNEYDNYYIAQVLIQFGDAWKSWSDRLREFLVQTQRADGHAAGSWDPRGRWSRSGGRLYSTALNVLILEVYYRHLPLYSERAFDILDPELARSDRPAVPTEASGRRRSRRETLDAPVAAVEPTPAYGAQPETLAGMDCPTRYILNYPTAGRFCGPIASTFEDAERDFAVTTAGRRVGQHRYGGFGLPLLQVGTQTFVHTGADYGWYQGGEPVHAVAAGVVRLSFDPFHTYPDDPPPGERSARRQQLMDWGRTVIIEHRLPEGEYVTTLYAHLGLDGLVRTGDIVAAGQQIGTIGHKLDSVSGDNEPHLHFAVREGRMFESGSTLLTVNRSGRTGSVTLDEAGEHMTFVRITDGSADPVGVVPTEHRQLSIEQVDDGRHRIPSWHLWRTIPPEFRLCGYSPDLQGWLDPTLFLRDHQATVLPATRFALTRDPQPNGIPNIAGEPAPGWMIDDWIREPAGGLDVPQLRGRTIVMLCVQESCTASKLLAVPMLADAARRFGDSDDVVLILHQTAFTDFVVNSPANLERLLAELPSGIAVAHSGRPESRPVVLDDYGIRGTPWTIIIGRDGVVEFSGCLLDSSELIRIVEVLRGQTNGADGT